jgi:peroxiredoxin
MAQLRRDFDAITRRDAVVVVVGPEDREALGAYFREHELPFIGLPDPKHRVLGLYGQQVKLLRLGRLPAQLIIDKQGLVRFAHYSESMQDIASTQQVLEVLDGLNRRE